MNHQPTIWHPRRTFVLFLVAVGELTPIPHNGPNPPPVHARDGNHPSVGPVAEP